MRESAIQKYRNMVGKVYGKYTVLRFEEELIDKNTELRFKVRCNKCGWIGITGKKSLFKPSKGTKCTHIGGNTIHKGDKFGKYIVIKKAPAKLCNNGLLVPYYMCKCTRCGKLVKVATSTLYATKNRKSYDTCRHSEEVK